MLPELYSSPAPYVSGTNTPIAKVETTHTPFTVKSLGLKLERYALTNNSEPDFISETNIIKIDEGNVNTVGFYSGLGAPVGLNLTDNFVYKYSGYFYADVGGEVDFKIAGFGYVHLSVNNNTLIGNIFPPRYEIIDDKIPTSVQITLTSGTWVPITLEYYALTEEAGLSVIWKNEDNNIFIPLSAGITSETQSYLSANTVNLVSKIDINDSGGDSSSLTFEVPLTEEDGGGDGYYFDEPNDRYIDKSSPSDYLKKYEMVEGYLGYMEGESPSWTERYIKKFIGHIHRIESERSSDGHDKLKVYCEGFPSLLKSSINLNYPDKLDYWNADFTGLEFNDVRPDGLDYPPTYDGWPLNAVMKSLLYRGSIDPYLFYEKSDFLDSNNSIVKGNYLLEESNPLTVLEKARNYGNPNSIITFEEPDDEYRLSTNFGDTIFDYINKAVEPYGWEWGNSPYYEGAFYLRTRNNPTSILTVKDAVVSGTWNAVSADLSAIGGVYRTTVNQNDYMEWSFTGSCIEAVMSLRNENAGTQAEVSSVPDGSTLEFKNIEGDGFTVGNRIIIYHSDSAPESTLISNNLGSNFFNVNPPLVKIPKINTRIKTAVGKLEVVRGETFSGGTLVETRYLPAYHYNFYNAIAAEPAPDGLKRQFSVSGTNRLFYDGFDRETLTNPVVFFGANGLVREKHIARITRIDNDECGPTSILGVNCIFVHDKNRLLENFTYESDVNLINVGVQSEITEQRNDVVVVGRKTGVFVPGTDESQVVNPNNPISTHITSRAVDVGSIFNPDSKNFTGRQLQTILIEPSIGSQDRADDWAVKFLNRYRFPGRRTKVVGIGNPLLEIGDTIKVIDKTKNTTTENLYWLNSIDSSWGTDRAIDTLDVVSYPPWSSFVPKAPVDIADFGNQAFVNFSISNGDSSSSPYDPYTSEDGTLVEISFDLVVSGYLRAQIFGFNGQLVADLLNPTGDKGKKGFIRETFGKNKKITWDAVDLEGKWNEGRLQAEGNPDPKNWFVAEDPDLGYGKFYVLLTVESFDGTSYTFNSSSSDQFIYTLRGPEVQLVSAFHDKNGFAVPFELNRNILNPPYVSTLGFDDIDDPKIFISTTRKAQLSIQIIPKIFGYVNLNSPSGRIRHGPVTPEEIPKITNSNFIKYSSEYVELKLRDRGFIWEDYIGVFQVNPEDDWIENQRWIGWYFLFLVTATDKSGRTSVAKFPHYWHGASKAGDVVKGVPILTPNTDKWIVAGGTFDINGENIGEAYVKRIV